jgi:hypothetical protein
MLGINESERSPANTKNAAINQGTTLKKPVRPGVVGRSLRRLRANTAMPATTGPSIITLTKFHQGAGLRTHQAHRNRCRKDLWNCVNRQSGKDSIMRFRPMQERNQKRQAKNDNNAENRCAAATY